MIRSTAFNLYAYTLTLLAALVGIVLAPIPSPAPLRALLQGYARAIRWGMRWIGGMTVEVRGRQSRHRLRRHARAVQAADRRHDPLSPAGDPGRRLRRRQGARAPRPVRP